MRYHLLFWDLTFHKCWCNGGMVPIPGGVFWVYLTGVAFLAAAISIIIETKVRLACILLGALLFIFVLSIHLPAVIGGEMQSSMPNLLKDLALAGGAWYIAGNYETESTAKPAV